CSPLRSTSSATMSLQRTRPARDIPASVPPWALSCIDETEHPLIEKGATMDEHDDDLTSEVHEGADLEIDSFPDTEDELDDELIGDEGGEEEEEDEDKSEL